jgi:hypothetical protein
MDISASNGYIASPWRSALCRCSDIPTKLQFCKVSFCEVPSGTYCNFSILAFFLLSFLAFFPSELRLGGSFPILILIFLGHSHFALLRFFPRIQVYHFFFIWGRNFNLRYVFDVPVASTSGLLVSGSFDLFSCSSINCAILLVMKSFNSCLFVLKLLLLPSF